MTTIRPADVLKFAELLPALSQRPGATAPISSLRRTRLCCGVGSCCAARHAQTPPRPTAPVSLWGDGATWQSDALATDWRPAARATAGVPSRVEPPWIGARNSSSEVSFSDVRRQISLFLRDTDDSQETAAEDTTGDTTDIPIDATPPTPTRRASGSFTPMSCRTPIRKPRTPSRSGPPPVRRHQCRPTATRVGLDLVSGSPAVAGHVAPLG